jgi:hypothetical protein
MATQLILPNPKNEPLQQLYENWLFRLRDPRILQKQLTKIDRTGPFRRIYVMGCGRSGTWLLTHVMNTFNDTDVVLKELTVEFFGVLVPDRPILVLKRDHIAYQRIEQIPECIEIAYIVRHPFDVLTSHLPSSNRPFHILPERWLGEMRALHYLLDSRRKMTKIIRYEDLVRKPVEGQSKLADFFQLSIGVSIDTLYTSSNNSTEAPTHLSRKIDIYSIEKYKRDQKKLDYLRRVRPELGQMLDWVGKTYEYDISL